MITDASDFQLHILRQVGVTDEVDTCFCCGKQDLMRTVVFETTEEWQTGGGDQFVFFGTTCAKKRNPLIPGKARTLLRKTGVPMDKATTLHMSDDATVVHDLSYRETDISIYVSFYINGLTGEALIDGTAPLASVITTRKKIVSIAEARVIYKEVRDLIDRAKAGCLETKKEWIAGKWCKVAA